MTNFWVGVVSSVIASVLLGTVGWLWSQRMRQLLLSALSRLTGVGIARSYRTQQEANADLSADLAEARWVKVLAGRGNELTRDSFRRVWEEADSRLESVQVLLPNADAGADSWLAVREAEIARHDPGYRPGLLLDQVRANVSYLRAATEEKDHVELRLYDLPNICRLVLTDRVAYLTAYQAASHGRSSPCLVFRHPSAMYDFAVRLFTTSWLRAVSPPGVDRHVGEDQAAGDDRPAAPTPSALPTHSDRHDDPSRAT